MQCKCTILLEASLCNSCKASLVRPASQILIQKALCHDIEIPPALEALNIALVLHNHICDAIKIDDIQFMVFIVAKTLTLIIEFKKINK